MISDKSCFQFCNSGAYKSTVVPYKRPGPVHFEQDINLENCTVQVEERMRDITSPVLIQLFANWNNQSSHINKLERTYRILHLPTDRTA